MPRAKENFPSATDSPALADPTHYSLNINCGILRSDSYPWLTSGFSASDVISLDEK